jgi:hypothetical protein
MVMRYYMGLAVGHTYAKLATQETRIRDETMTTIVDLQPDNADTESANEEPVVLPFTAVDTDYGSGEGSGLGSDESDMSEEDGSDESDMSEEDGSDEDYSDREFLAMEEMYGY